MRSLTLNEAKTRGISVTRLLFYDLNYNDFCINILEYAEPLEISLKMHAYRYLGDCSAIGIDLQRHVG